MSTLELNATKNVIRIIPLQNQPNVNLITNKQEDAKSTSTLHFVDTCIYQVSRYSIISGASLIARTSYEIDWRIPS